MDTLKSRGLTWAVARTWAVATTAITPWLLRRRGVRVGHECRAWGLPIVRTIHPGQISIGDRVGLVSSSRLAPISTSQKCALQVMAPGGRIEIGDDAAMTGVTLTARTGIIIGQRVLLGSGVVITDNDAHPIDSVPRRYEPAPEPLAENQIVIEDDVFVGARSIVLRGVRIGCGTVVGAGSVVTSSLPPMVLAAGNPARVIRDLRA